MSVYVTANGKKISNRLKSGRVFSMEFPERVWEISHYTATGPIWFSRVPTKTDYGNRLSVFLKFFRAAQAKEDKPVE